MGYVNIFLYWYCCQWPHLQNLLIQMPFTYNWTNLFLYSFECSVPWSCLFCRSYIKHTRQCDSRVIRPNSCLTCCWKSWHNRKAIGFVLSLFMSITNWAYLVNWVELFVFRNPHFFIDWWEDTVLHDQFSVRFVFSFSKWSQNSLIHWWP